MTFKAELDAALALITKQQLCVAFLRELARVEDGAFVQLAVDSPTWSDNESGDVCFLSDHGWMFEVRNDAGDWDHIIRFRAPYGPDWIEVSPTNPADLTDPQVAIYNWFYQGVLDVALPS